MNKKLLLSSLAAAAFAVGSVHAQIAVDFGSNYGTTANWTNGSNLGTGFGNWVFESSQGTGSAGVFIGNPGAAGISGMSDTSFGFFANPIGSGATAQVYRSFSNSLAVGDVFSFQWGLNWDSNNADSNRGFNLFSGGVQLVNINMGNSSTITIGGNPMFTEFGTQGFTLNFEQVSATSLRVFGTGRNGTETYDNTFTGLAGAADGFVFYFNATEANDNRQMYVNNLEIVPEPSTYALLTLSALALGGYAARRRARK